jgi:hypothetical protein
MTSDTLWQDLVSEKSGRPFNGLLIRRIRPQAQCSLFLGLEEPGDHRLLILQVKRSTLPGQAVLPKAPAIEVRSTTLPGSDDTLGALILVLKEDRYSDVFEVLVRDLAEALSQVATDQEAVALFIGRLMKWHRFLEASQGEGLADEAQRGLYGELWFLKYQLLQRVGSQGISLWTGFARTPHDFACPHGSVEVKTTLVGGSPLLQIHGARQLDETTVPRLLLCHLTLIAGAAEGETLTEMVAAVRHHLHGQGRYRARFEASLLEAGFHDRHTVRYSATTYGVHNMALFEVHGDFPRIRQCDLRAGIKTLNYAIEMAACAVHEVPHSYIDALLAD